MDQTLPTDHLLQASQKWEMPFTMDQSKMQYSISLTVKNLNQANFHSWMAKFQFSEMVWGVNSCDQ